MTVFAICANRVTCAAMGCHRPGTVLVRFAMPPVDAVDSNDRHKFYEVPVVELEYCEAHLSVIVEQPEE